MLQARTDASQIRVVTAASVLAYRALTLACVRVDTPDVTANTVIRHYSLFNCGFFLGRPTIMFYQCQFLTVRLISQKADQCFVKSMA